ncbi:hypothetical protein C9374_014084 [Naegleria lovaniensis]|uniref:Kinase n=1 Tax=Naegleria lovaniensis TaxID=51637 RepID=A0AA88H1K2_NAELO|nr:uncharacterized protein C9374_014084 [Naegleria lovaniensis]KAG2389524.1 hypothetical protein C9374_014084 [Naegleria lovaniensis]
MEEDFKGSIKKSEYDINTEEESDNEEEYDTEEEYFNGYTKEEYDKMFESGYDLPSWENIVQLITSLASTTTSNNNNNNTHNTHNNNNESSSFLSYNPSSSHEMYSNNNNNTTRLTLPHCQNEQVPLASSSSSSLLSSSPSSSQHRPQQHHFENKLISMNHQIETLSSSSFHDDSLSTNGSNHSHEEELSEEATTMITVTTSSRRNTTTSPLTPSSLCTTPSSSRCNTPHINQNSSIPPLLGNDENCEDMVPSGIVTNMEALTNCIQNPEENEEDTIYQPNLIINSQLSLSSMRVVRNREEILSPCVGRKFHNLSTNVNQHDEEEQVDLIGVRVNNKKESVDVKKRASDVDQVHVSGVTTNLMTTSISAAAAAVEEEYKDNDKTCSVVDTSYCNHNASIPTTTTTSSLLSNLVQKRVSICEAPSKEDLPSESSNWRRESMSERRDAVFKNDLENEKPSPSSSSTTLEATSSNGKPFKFLQKRPSFINPQLVNILFASLLSLQDLKPSENQVAGHGQKDGEEHLVVRHLRDKIYKPINTKSKRAFDEVKFYETQAPKIPLLEPYLPKYYGVQTVQENDQQFLVLEDLTAPFINPSLLDIRMGRRVYGDDASPEKIKMFDEKYIYQKELGFSFSGMKVYNTTPNFASTNTNPDITQKDGKYKVYNRYWGRNCKPGEESVKALEDFFFDTTYDNAEQVGLKSITSMLNQLKHLEQLFNTHQLIYRIYSSSLFLVFDDHEAIVRMIDFAHVHENKEPCVDENYVYGLSMLIYYFEQVLKRRSPTNGGCTKIESTTHGNQNMSTSD